MSPEVMEAPGGDAPSDQFSFCVMAYEALYRSRPFRGDHARRAGRVGPRGAGRAAGRRARPPPRGIWRCIRRGLAVAKERRWPTMAPLLAGLERAAAAPRRRRVAVAAAAVLALTASSVVVLASPGPRRGGARARGRGGPDGARCGARPGETACGPRSPGPRIPRSPPRGPAPPRRSTATATTGWRCGWTPGARPTGARSSRRGCSSCGCAASIASPTR